jgi:hypothetical protein
MEALTGGLSLSVVLKGTLTSLGEDISLSRLCHVSVVISHHLEEESAALTILSAHAVSLDHINNILAILL